jgi:hypothetical protein
VYNKPHISNTNSALHASLDHTRERQAEDEELVIDIQTCVERHSISDALGTKEIVVRLKKWCLNISLHDKKTPIAITWTYDDEQEVIVRECGVVHGCECERFPLAIDKGLVVRLAF